MAKDCGPRKFTTALENVVTPFTLGPSGKVTINANAGRMTLIISNNGPDPLQAFPAGFQISGPPMCTMNTEMYVLKFDEWGPMVAGSWTFVTGLLGTSGSLVETNWTPTAKVS